MSYAIPKDPRILLLGLLPRDSILKKDRYIFKIQLIASKKAITRNWLKTDPPRVSARDYRGNASYGETDFPSTTKRSSLSTALD